MATVVAKGLSMQAEAQQHYISTNEIAVANLKIQPSIWQKDAVFPEHLPSTLNTHQKNHVNQQNVKNVKSQALLISTRCTHTHQGQ